MSKIRTFFIHPLFLTIIRVIVGGIFLLFGFVKAIEPLSIFFESIAAYQMVPGILIPPFGVIVLILEIVFGLFLILGLFSRLSNRVILFLLLIFMIAIGQAMIRGLYLPDCGCSGSFIRLGETPAQVLSRDILFFIGLLYLEGVKKYGYTLDAFLEKRKKLTKLI